MGVEESVEIGRLFKCPSKSTSTSFLSWNDHHLDSLNLRLTLVRKATTLTRTADSKLCRIKGSQDALLRAKVP